MLYITKHGVFKQNDNINDLKVGLRYVVSVEIYRPMKYIDFKGMHKSKTCRVYGIIKRKVGHE